MFRSRRERDPTEEFRDYASVRESLRRHSEAPEDQARVEAVFASRGLPTPPPAPEEALAELEKDVPEFFPALAQNSDFADLLGGLTDVTRLRDKVRRFSPATGAPISPTEGRIVLSYRREDSAQWVQRLADDLRRRFGADRIVDVASIKPGAKWTDLLEGTEVPDVVLAVIGPRWTERLGDSPGDFSSRELAIALQRSETTVIPVLVAGAALPAAADIPSELRPLLYLQAAELSEQRWPYDVERLADAIESLLVRRPSKLAALDKMPEVRVPGPPQAGAPDDVESF